MNSDDATRHLALSHGLGPLLHHGDPYPTQAALRVAAAHDTAERLQRGGCLAQLARLGLLRRLVHCEFSLGRGQIMGQLVKGLRARACASAWVFVDCAS